MRTETPDIFISKSLKIFTKGTFTIIGLFAVLHCTIVALVLLFVKTSEGNPIIEGYAFILLLVFASLPIILFFVVFEGFLCVVKSHCKKKLSEPSNSGNEENILKKQKIKTIGKTCHILARAIKPNSEFYKGASEEILKQMLDIFSKKDL